MPGLGMLVMSGQSRKMYLHLKAKREGAIFTKRSLPQRNDQLSPRLIGPVSWPPLLSYKRNMSGILMLRLDRWLWVAQRTTAGAARIFSSPLMLRAGANPTPPPETSRRPPPAQRSARRLA